MYCFARARSTTSCWWWAASLFLLALSPLPAQAPARRADLAALLDTLRATTTPAALPTNPEPLASTEDLVREGFVQLRTAQLTGDRALLLKALQTFDQARWKERDWPYPRFGLALAKLALDRDNAISRPDLGGQMAGESYLDGYRRNLDETFARDSMFEPALRWAVELVASGRDRAQPGVLADAVARAVRRWPDDSLTHLALGYLDRTALRYGDAQQEFARYGQLGGDVSISLLEQARALAGGGRLAEAARFYLAGLAIPSDSARALYRRDLSWVANARELGAFDAQPRDSLVPWVLRFWHERDALSLRGEGERLREHLRRWAFVYRNFRVEHPERWSPFVRVWAPHPGLPCSRSLPDSLNAVVLADDASRVEDVRQEETILDHRAIIYMRHGEPANTQVMAPFIADSAITLSTGAVEPDADSIPGPPAGDAPEVQAMSTVWLYWIAGRARVYYFASGLPNSTQGPQTLVPSPPMNAALLRFLSGISPVFARAAHRVESYSDSQRHAVPLACLPTIQDLAVRTEHDIQTAVRTDSYSLLFSSDLDALMQVYQVGSAANGTARLLVTSAIPGRTLAPLGTRDGGGIRYPIHVRVTAVDSVRLRVWRLDTVRVFEASTPVDTSAYLGLVSELPVSAGRYVAHAALFDSSASVGSAAEWGGVAVTGDAFALSDVVLGTETGGVRWDNHGDPVRVNVTGGYTRSQPAPIYFEVYGRIPGRGYRTEISVHERGHPDRSGVTLQYTRPASRPDEHERLTLDLSRLSPGTYELTVAITDTVGGQRITTSRVIEVVKPRR